MWREKREDTMLINILDVLMHSHHSHTKTLIRIDELFDDSVLVVKNHVCHKQTCQNVCKRKRAKGRELHDVRDNRVNDFIVSNNAATQNSQ